MRIYERLQYFTAIGTFGAHCFGLSPNFVNISQTFLTILFVLGMCKEGFRTSQLPFVITFLIFKLTFAFTGHFVHWPLLCGLTASISSWFIHGEGDYSKFRPSGKFRVGFRQFKSKEFGNDCAIFYPAADDGSGDYSVPFLPYG